MSVTKPGVLWWASRRQPRHRKTRAPTNPTRPRQAAEATKNLIITSSLVVFLAACAGTVNAPTLTSAPPPGFDAARVPIGQVSGEAGLGVAMIPSDVARVTQKVQAALTAEYPTRVIAGRAAAPPGEVNIKLQITEYDKGNAFARAMLAGLGSMHIHANVMLVDASTAATVATYQVTKDFAWGGLYGGTTSIEDLEDGFAKSVAAIFTKT